MTIHREGIVRFLIVTAAVLVVGGCFGRGRVVTSSVDANRSIEDLRNCAVEQLNGLGYTITDSRTTAGSVEAVKPQGAETAGLVDRIEILAQDRSERVVVSGPATTLSATARTIDGSGRNQTPSEQVRTDASRVLSTCAPQAAG